MMKTNKKAVWIAALLSSGMILVAEEHKDKDTLPRNQNQNSTSTGLRTDTDRSSITSTPAAMPTESNKASKLVGMEVRNQDGEKIGSIKDLVINFEEGKVSYAVLSTGGVLGFGNKLLAVPLTAFTRSVDQGHLMLDVDKDSLASAVGIGESWPSVENPAFGASPFWKEPAGSSTFRDSTTIPRPNGNDTLPRTRPYDTTKPYDPNKPSDTPTQPDRTPTPQP